MTKQQRYEVVAVEPGFELRRYPERVVAEVEVDASFESAGNQAFRPLVSYIGRGGIAMTAPVVQTQDTDLDTALATMTEAGYEIAGAPRYPRFDPPWTPWFARHNEVVVPVRRA